MGRINEMPGQASTFSQKFKNIIIYENQQSRMLPLPHPPKKEKKRMKSENFTQWEHNCTKEKDLEASPEHHLKSTPFIYSAKTE